MKKIKILHWFIITLIIGYSLYFLANIYLTIYTPDFMNFNEEFYDKFIFGYYTQFVGLVFSLIVFVALFFLKNGLKLTICKGFFNQNSSKKLKVAGKLFLIYGIINLIWDTILLFYSKGELYFASGITTDFLLILIGFGLLIIVDFINNGNILQLENDLTI